MTAVATEQALARLARPLRVRSRAGWAAAAIGVAALVLGSAAWLARWEILTAPWWVLAAWVIAAGALVGVLVMAWRQEAWLAPRAFARSLEKLGGWRHGAISALLERPAPGTSEALFGLADAAGAADLTDRGPAATTPLTRSIRRRLLAGIGALVLGLLVLGAAGPVRGVAAALWHPAKALEATLAPVRLRAGAAQVDRGAKVALDVEAVGRRKVTLWLRAPGEGWRPMLLPLDSLGRARFMAGPLESDLFARATSGRRTSDTVEIHVRLPVFIGAVTVTAHYPSYLRLDDEPVQLSGDTILAPAGTRFETKGEATAPLASAGWKIGDANEEMSVSAARFSGSFTPRSSGVYRLSLVTAAGAPLAGDTLRLPIRLVADSAPRVDIPIPGSDTIAPLNLLIPLVIDARDDHGIRNVSLETRRISQLGGADPVRRESVPLPSGTTDRGILSYTLDLNRRGLLPGDTLRYTAVATDNSPTGQTGRSREFVLRLPTMSEVRAAERQTSRVVAERLDSLAAESKQLERRTEDLAREQPRTDYRQDGKQPDALAYEEAKRAEAVAAQQQNLVAQAEGLQQSLEALQKAAEAAGLKDSAWQQQLAEIRDQLERALTPELREQLQKLQQALKDLNADATKEALEQLTERQRQLREALEQAKELFRRAAIEGDLANLSQESRDLAQEQKRWSEQVGAADSARAASAEAQLATRTDSLASALGQLAPQMPAERKDMIEQVAQQAGSAARQMQQAGKSAQKGQRDRARQEGRKAAEQLEPLGESLDQQREGLQQEWRQEISEGLDRALAETTRLSERQLAIARGLQRSAPTPTIRGEQAAVQEGVGRLQSQIRGLSGKNALVPRQIAEALAAAELQMSRSLDAVSSSNPNTREASERAGTAVDALNVAAYQLLRARSSVAGASSGSGLAEAMERMAQLAGQQGQIGQQAQGLMGMMGDAGVGEQLRQLGARQRAMAEELEKLRGQANMPGAGEMADEAKDLARRLEAQRLDRETVERQERLFRRMLDAGRTLQGRQEDDKKERQSTTAKNDSVHLPPALREALLQDDNQLRVPTWEELQRLSPEDRRLVVDYFRRLSEREK
ncbi:MAG TPA: hypothetical protein VL287_04020 [Gemmatimonadales bacterium]|nr:hypothetical protein [Gemmatimonadales bacterium]